MVVDVQMLLAVLHQELMPVAERPGVIAKGAIERATAWRNEADRAVIQHVDSYVSFVHLPVVKATETDEVRQLRLAAVRPVLDVMPVEITCVRTAREATAAVISRIECALNGGRNGARFTAYVEGLALLVFDEWDDAAVAG